MYRYKYINKLYNNIGALHGVYCNPVIVNGKCVVSPGKQLVVFEDEEQHIVIRRCLRLVSKLKEYK